ncbi:putative ABC transport system permease protein [Abditibacterium utsteinense]|uniref:Putative ABC transport system permease protein n=1 Tax=Abditibacterium utsteinense TaxID=1960156 RepID=A0A2S8SQA1_9BACT|nr:FtsX-like permease family protein [Abditibacterium utsteinense]PQV62974.1 putative ABC transport system permease protein [Abditibacterium utsteinense]
MFYGLRYLSGRYWLRHRGAFLLASLGVALGIAVFVAIQIANASVLGAFSASLDATTGRANLQIRGGPGGLPDALFARIQNKNDPRITAMAPFSSRTLFSPTLQTSILVAGVDLFSEIDFRAFDLDSTKNESARDQPLSFLLDPHAIALSKSLAARGDLKVGSKLELLQGPTRQSFFVAAILDDQASGRAFGGDFALLDIASAQEAFGEVGQINQIDFLVDEKSIDSLIPVLQKMAPPDARVGRPAQRSAQVAAILGAFQLNLTALSSIATFVGAFLIYNALASAVVRRRAEAGILRAVGASKRQLMALFLVEAACIGLFGSICGVLIGLVLAKWTLIAVATTVSQLYLAVKAREIFVPFWLWWAAPLAGTLLSTLAAIPAALEAASTLPRQTLSVSSLHLALERNATRFLAAGIALLGVAGALCLPVVSAKSPLLGFGAAGATLGAFALATPWVLLRGALLIRPWAEKFGGIEGALAADNLRRALNRSSLVVAALLVSLSLTIGMNVMVRSFRDTVADWVSGSISADLFIATSNGFEGQRGPGIPREVIDFATTVEAVATFDTLRQAQLEIGGQNVVLLANELPSIQLGQRKLSFIAQSQSGYSDFVSGRAVLLSERLANLLRKGVGNEITLPTPSGLKTLPIGGVFYDYNPNAVMYLARETYKKWWRDDEVDGVALYLQGENKGARAEIIKRQIDQRYGAKYALRLLPNAEIRRQVFDTFDQTFAVTYALQLIALVVAAFGVFDTLVAMILERTSEFASLRAMGASAAQIRKMAFWEFGMLAFFAYLLGCFAGILLACEMIFVINKQFFGWTIFPTLRPEILLQAALLAFGAIALAGFFPARQAARRDLAGALQRE